MGLIGSQLGKVLGETVGQKYGGSTGKVAGGLVGAGLGTLFPYFKNGGRVPGKKGAPKKIIAHGGEYVLPVGVKPTKAQVKAVASKKSRAMKGKK